MNSYKLRITIDDEKEPLYRAMETKYFSSYVRCRETGKETEKPHYHYFLKCSESNALRQFIQKNVGRGNGFYSLKALTEEYPIEYLSYLTKEDPETVWCNVPEEIKENTTMYASEVKHQIKTHRKEGRISVLRLALIQRFGSVPINKGQLASEIMEIYLSNRWTLNIFHMRQYAQTLLAEVNPAYKTEFVNRLTEMI